MHVKPMLATASHIALDKFDDRWIFEPKFDGIRCIAEGGRLWSRAGNDITDRFPEIRVSEDMKSMTLDGEIIILDETGVPQFSLVARRTAKKIGLPAFLRVFDIPSIGHTPFEYRRSRLEILHAIGGLGDNITLTEQSKSADEMWARARAAGHEGIMAKLVSSRYVGGRSKSWLKVKKSARLSAIVVGATPGSGKRAGTVGSLELALLNTNNQAVHIGEVGTGFDSNDLAHVSGLLSAGQPFVVEIEYMEVTEAGQLRFPSFKGVRDDITVLDCTVDQLTGSR
jgi:bifunctional non-homologous end joining protein LigD